MYLMYNLLEGISLQQIGEILGGRNHATIIHGVKKISERAGEDAELSGSIDNLKKNLKKWEGYYKGIYYNENSKRRKSMKVLTIEVKLYASWIQSLKEKRMVVKSLVAKLVNKFHVSVAEIDAQDVHKKIVIGIAVIVDSQKKADQMEECIINFIEDSTEAQILEIVSEIR